MIVRRHRLSHDNGRTACLLVFEDGSVIETTVAYFPMEVNRVTEDRTAGAEAPRDEGEQESRDR